MAFEAMTGSDLDGLRPECGAESISVIEMLFYNSLIYRKRKGVR